MNMYTVKQGDWLSKIAIEEGLTLEQLLQANPRLRANPDLIMAGEEIVLPQSQAQKQAQMQKPTFGPMPMDQALAVTPSTLTQATAKGPYDFLTDYSTPAGASVSSISVNANANDNANVAPAPANPSVILPESSFGNDTSCTEAKGTARCQTPIFEIVHITGEGADGFYVLDEEQSNALREEIATNEGLMSEYGDLCKDAPGAAASDEDRLAHINAKKDWLIKAAERQLIPLKYPEIKQCESHYPQKKVLDDEISVLQEQRIQIRDYRPLDIFSHGSAQENNWIKLRDQLLVQIDNGISVKQRRLNEYTNGQPKDSKSYANNAMPTFQVRTSELRHTKTVTKVKVVELIVFSQPGRWRYVSAAFIEQTQQKAKWWKVSNSSKIKQIIAGSKTGAMTAIAKELVDQIRDDIKKSKENFKTELKLWEAKSDDDHALNVLHKELFNVSTSKDRNPNDAVFAAGADAQLLRFAAVASASITNFDPRKGPIEIGGKAEANFALLEGSVNASVSLPNEAGYACAITYRDGNGQEVRHSFGAYRLQGQLTLSCFTGVKAGVSACVYAGDAEKTGCYDPKNAEEGVASVSALLAPAIEMGINPTGGVGFKGEAFAGTQAGGQLSGSLQWKPPVRPKQEQAPDWSSLLELKTEGNLALGIGAGLDFGLKLIDAELRFYAHGRLVFGPGAAGGFGGVVDVDKIFDLVVLVCDVLSEVDYRYLLNVDEDVFESFYLGLVKAYTDPVGSLQAAFTENLEDLQEWGTFRQSKREEAQQLATTINANPYQWSLSKLPPESLGMMLYTLSETFIEVNEDAQETAILTLLRSMRNWRHFIKALEHMSLSGAKAQPLASLDRLNAILDGDQQQAFNRWIDRLKSEGQPQPGLAPYPAVPVWKKFRLVDGQMVALRSGQRDDKQLA